MSGCAFNPTPEQRELVEAMIGSGMLEDKICRVIKNPKTGKPITVKTLRKHFAAEITAAAVKVDALVDNWITKTILGRGDVKDERLRVQLAIAHAKYRRGRNEIVTTSGAPVGIWDVNEARQRNLEMIAQVSRRLRGDETGEPSEERDSFPPKPKHRRIG
jgi:hypothetical protein